ncbi:hypothetical protein E1281_01925 [Actinomadura sp. KC345]|uniref:hypothetical protein n=1 Tax=Actinomadura sp. KC345 TaxID=2530371 RepID=UPI00104790D9|nr:hypothetical protein [Actinomadura sp. KC345]TDC58285.1 hypothetical protein E1281_01925 [Actinomadura sp. KC345]
MGSDMPARNAGTVVRAGARGLVAAMAMTGVRTVTAAVGPHEETPPEAFVKEHLPFLGKLPPRHQEALTELFHWTYGAAGGVAYGLLPRGIRGSTLSGPLYGLAIWLGFEAGIAPMLGVRHVHEHGFQWRAAVALDHVLYGVVVGGRLAPEPAGSGGRVTRRRLPPLRPGRGPR